MKRVSLWLGAMVFAASPLIATAQHPGYSGPSAKSGYTGPSSVQTITVKQLLTNGKDDQYATLHGKLVRHIGGKHYILADDTGEIEVEINHKYFPAEQTIGPDAVVELTGKFDKDFIGTSELEVKQMIKVLKR